MSTTANKIKLVSDRVERAKSLLLSQFKGSPNINTLVEVLVTELQQLENTLCDLQDVRTLDKSYGVWLDEIGRQLKVDRGSYNDNDYKTAIKLEMFRKTASATKEDILRIVELLTGDSDAILLNKYPYMMELTSFLYCIGDDLSGLDLIGQLFPANTALKINKKFRNSFKFGTTSRGFNSGSSLNSLVYTKYGLINDPRFVSVDLAIIPPVLPSAPLNVIPPLITGEVILGNQLVTSTGSWVGDEPITYTYQWLRNNIPLVGETSAIYTITIADVSSELSCIVTATNNVDSISVSSNFVVIPEEPATPPAVNSTLGLRDTYSISISESGIPVNCVWVITFNPDGTVRTQDQLDTTNNWGTDVSGSDYTVEYSILSGAPLNLPPNVPVSLSTSRAFTDSLTSNTNQIKVGRYQFTIRDTRPDGQVFSKTIIAALEISTGILF